MANSPDEAQHNRGEGDVSSCVSNLIHAFTNGFDIFKRLRERRRRKSRKHAGQTGQPSVAELQLSNSLRRGPQDIHESYKHHHSKAGDRYAQGDAIAHASLAQTLIKLNTGLVNIIASFLSHDSGSNHLKLDYKSLTNLSNASRAEAIESLNQLYQRMSQSQLQVYGIGGCNRCGSTKHHNCSAGVGAGHTKRPSEKKTHTSSGTRPNGPTVARMPIKSSSQAQLVVLRPRNTRKSSSGSSSSTQSQTAALRSPPTSPPGSPLPQYAPKDPFPTHKSTTKAQGSAGRRRRSSIDGPRPTTWPHTRPDASIPIHLPPPKPRESPPPRETHHTNPAQYPVKRRIDKATPSTYTFASDSTKLGEIPQRNWTAPFNYAEAERLNEEALLNGYPPPPAGDFKPKAKKGLFSFLRRGSAINS